MGPRVVVSSDIHNVDIGGGDHDDAQSMGHLLLYADELDLVGLLPYRFDVGGREEILRAIAAYGNDFNRSDTRYKELGYPEPEELEALVPRDYEHGVEMIIREARKSSEDDPLWVLVWGNMTHLRDALIQARQDGACIADNIRVISIATNIKLPGESQAPMPGTPNWNSIGRPEVYHTDAFAAMWWLEIDWAYKGMSWTLCNSVDYLADLHTSEDYAGLIDEGKELMRRLREDFGDLGQYIWDVSDRNDWSRPVEGLFRAGDTPTVLYLIDPDNDIDDPTAGSWAGEYCAPFPEERPHYYTGIDGGHEWNFAIPRATWDNAEDVAIARVTSVLDRRQEWYDDWLDKLTMLYPEA